MEKCVDFSFHLMYNRSCKKDMKHETEVRRKEKNERFMANNSNSRRYVKLSIPLQDAAVLEWLNNQESMSDSIRALIRDDVAKNGYGDFFCREIIPGAKRGRPTNAELQARAEQESAMNGGTVSMTSPAVSVPKVQTRIQQVQKPVSCPQPIPQGDLGMDEDGNIDPEKLLGLL